MIFNPSPALFEANSLYLLDHLRWDIDIQMYLAGYKYQKGFALYRTLFLIAENIELEAIPNFYTFCQQK